MDRIEIIKNTIERNSKMMKKHTLRIQELKDELDRIDSQIKWAPVSDMDEEMEKDLRGFYKTDIGGILYMINPELTKETIKNSRARELSEKRVPLQNELDTLIREKERLRNENLRLREEARNLK